VKRAVAWAVWWLALFWLWLLLAGEWNRQEWVASAAAATLGASIGELARARTGFPSHVPLRAVADVPKVLAAVFVDFGIVAWALVASALRRRVVRGSFRSRPLTRPRDARGSGRRAWTVLASSYSPNAYVIDLDREQRTVLLHDLVPRRASEEPA
jgi:multisubunit Na+/H+ antiporter MnhE subunit